MTEVNERELEDDYPIHQGYLYVVDGKVWKSDRKTNVGTLKLTHKFKDVKSCDINARDLWHLAV